MKYIPEILDSSRAMTGCVMLSGAQRSRRICMATAYRLREGQHSYSSGIIQVMDELGEILKEIFKNNNGSSNSRTHYR